MSDGARPRYAVIGGGISGLAAARELAARGEVTVFEAAPRFGGKISTSEVAGVAVDAGAEAFLARTPEAVDLARELGLADALVHPDGAAAAVFSRGRLRALPARTLMGVPADLRALARSRVLSPPGLARARVEPWLPAAPRLDADMSVAHAVGRRFGAEVVDRLVEPLLGGVYAGRADGLSVEATLPALAPAARAGGSLLRAARRALPAPAPGPPAPVFATIVGGLGRLVDALTAQLRAQQVRLQAGAPVTELERTPGGFRLRAGDAREFDAVVLACPAAPAARLLARVVPGAAAELAGVEYASIAIATFAFDARAVPPLSGSGFLVPAVERRTVKAATFSSTKWAHLRGEHVLVRASVGRAGDTADLQRGDDELLEAARADLAGICGLTARPVQARLTRWGGALPQYAPGHQDRIRRIRAALAGVPGLAACGALYDGVGIPACIRSARAAAAALP